MKALSIAVACLAATLAIAAFSPAAEAEGAKHLKLMLTTNPEAGPVTIETDELALGETRSFTSEKGRPVLLTRTDKGYELDVDGDKTTIAIPEPGGDGFSWETREETVEGDGGQKVERHVIVKRLGEGAAVQVEGDGTPRIEIVGDAPGGHQEVKVIRMDHRGGAPGEPAKMMVMLGGDGQFAAARAKLEASGALDGLDQATRDKILAALGGETQGQK